ncbi:type VI secretion system tip protein TssI/VgrG [Pseudomonas sp. MYb118]|uniref:type VI secretion system tip protein TssI/VgrG n=1 Tax=Pseudomonas sp. MYb118 TaxID=1848720 RepID=UPI0034CE292F
MFAPTSAALFTLSIPNIRNDFQVLSFTGTESLSALYSLDLEVVSEYPDFEIENLLSQPAFLQFGSNGEGIHGRIEHVAADELGNRLAHYHLSLVPALHYLKLSYNQRIFQKLTVPQIITQVLQQHGLQTDVFIFHVRTSEEREYCTQYDESDFDFIQRLCAEDGIAWHHQHSPEGHLLVFTDDPVFLPLLEATPYRRDAGMVAEHPVVSRFNMSFSSRTSRVTHRSYDLKRPNRLMESRFTTAFTPELEDYRYPLPRRSDEHCRKLARQSLERRRVDYQLVHGESNQPNLRSGHVFDLIEHPRHVCNDKWLLVSVTHTGKQPQVLEETMVHGGPPAQGFSHGYRNRFSAIQAEIAYRPPLCPRGKLVCQTARVTGPASEEIYCDEYGRVKVEFHWDRAELNNEFSSCWLRVASGWAGEGFGAVTIPRVGMEVVVTFLEGDPDQPLITGCVTNRINSTAHTLPEHKTRTVLRSQSSPRNGGYNELSIEDRAGLEKIYLRAQRDLEQLILRDSHLLIGNDRFEQVDGNNTSLIKGDDTRTTEGLRNTVIGGNEVLTVTGDCSTNVEGSLVIQASKQAHVTSSDVVISADKSLTLHAGGHHLVINTEGIFSSVPIVEGGAPLAAGQPLQALFDPGRLLPKSMTLAALDDRMDDMEEEEEEVEEQGLTLRIGVFFDGTANNRSNSELVAGCYARDVNLLEVAEDLRLFCEKHGYDGKGKTPNNSYGNDTTNVAKLHDLYRDDSKRQLADDETIGFIPVYLEGIGTHGGGADSRYSQMTGRGDQGVLARVDQSPAMIHKKAQQFGIANPDRKIERIEFDIFGFSRGAAAARHFANEVMKGAEGPLAGLLPAYAKLFVEGFSWRVKTDFSINFIGIFDTVAAIANLADNDLSLHNDINPGLKLHLAPDIAKKVVHLVARDEYRHNFSLNSAGAADIVLPGAHSDLGGGYLPRANERVLLSKPFRSRDIDLFTPSINTLAYRMAQYELAQLQKKLNLDALELGVSTWSKEYWGNTKNGESRCKDVYAVVSSNRIVRNDLALIYLRIMRELGVREGVPFRVIKESDPKFVLPEELQIVAQKLMAYAVGESRHLNLSVIEERLLINRYIHLSANWNATIGRSTSDMNITFADRPADKHERAVYPNE